MTEIARSKGARRGRKHGVKGEGYLARAGRPNIPGGLKTTTPGPITKRSRSSVSLRPAQINASVSGEWGEKLRFIFKTLKSAIRDLLCTRQTFRNPDAPAAEAAKKSARPTTGFPSFVGRAVGVVGRGGQLWSPSRVTSGHSRVTVLVTQETLTGYRLVTKLYRSHKSHSSKEVYRENDYKTRLSI